MTGQIETAIQEDQEQGKHGLPFELVVSLTSYWKRLPQVKDTLDCLMNQSVKPDRILLWVANEDKASVPKDVKDLDGQQIEIRYCDDIGPYKKMIPTLEAYKDAAVITADDDLWYSRHWVSDLVQTWTGLSAHVENPERYAVAHRAHGVTFDTRRNRIQPYDEWEYEVEPSYVEGAYKDAAACATARLFASSGTGLFVPPGPFRANLLKNKEAYLRLAPYTDDIAYFFAMGFAGMKTVLTPIQSNCVPFYIPQDSPLQLLNNRNRNNESVRALSKEMGLPRAFIEETVPFRSCCHTLSSINKCCNPNRASLLG